MPIEETFGFNEDDYIRSLAFMSDEELVKLHGETKKKKEEYDALTGVAAGGAAVLGLFTFGIGFLASAGTSAYAARQQIICKQKLVMIEKEVVARIQNAEMENRVNHALATMALLNELGVVVKT